MENKENRKEPDRWRPAGSTAGPYTMTLQRKPGGSDSTALRPVNCVREGGDGPAYDFS